MEFGKWEEMGKYLTRSAVLTAILAAPSLFGGCGTGAAGYEGLGGSGDPGSGGVEPGDTSAELAEDLTFLREEEKLARDVYVTLFDAWGLTIFSNISSAEQRHMDRVGETLDAFELPDPVVDDTVGAFTNPELADLFVQLVSDGLNDEVAALTVGATIEDLDIHDIQNMAARTDDATALATYEALECGSRNHMRAFMEQLHSRDADYDVQFISNDYFEEILASGQESCGSGGGGGGGGPR